MKKSEIEYNEKYGDEPNDHLERILNFLGDTRLDKKFKEKLSSSLDRINSITWETVRFVIYLLPKATPRPRHNFLRNTFYVMGAKDNKDIFAKALTKVDIPMIITPCKFQCVSYLPIPSSMSSVEKLLAEAGLIRPIVKPDWDNLGKTYSDMIQGTLLFDDSLIIEGVSKKYYSFKPRIEITIQYMTEFDSMYNEKKIRKKVDDYE